MDMERGILTLPTTKAGGVQDAHLNEEAKAILRGFDSWQRSKWFFLSENPATHLDGGTSIPVYGCLRSRVRGLNGLPGMISTILLRELAGDDWP